MLGYKLDTERRRQLNIALEAQRERNRLAGVAVADEGDFGTESVEQNVDDSDDADRK